MMLWIVALSPSSSRAPEEAYMLENPKSLISGALSHHL